MEQAKTPKARKTERALLIALGCTCTIIALSSIFMRANVQFEWFSFVQLLFTLGGTASTYLAVRAVRPKASTQAAILAAGAGVLVLAIDPLSALTGARTEPNTSSELAYRSFGKFETLVERGPEPNTVVVSITNHDYIFGHCAQIRISDQSKSIGNVCICTDGRLIPFTMPSSRQQLVQLSNALNERFNVLVYRSSCVPPAELVVSLLHRIDTSLFDNWREEVTSPHRANRFCRSVSHVPKAQQQQYRVRTCARLRWQCSVFGVDTRHRSPKPNGSASFGERCNLPFDLLVYTSWSREERRRRTQPLRRVLIESILHGDTGVDVSLFPDDNVNPSTSWLFPLTADQQRQYPDLLAEAKGMTRRWDRRAREYALCGL